MRETTTMAARLTALLLLALALFAPAAQAQVLPVCSETFEYPYPGTLHLQAGGLGWLNPWFIVQGVDDVSLFDSSVAPAFPLDDGVGVYAGQVVPYGQAYRKPDVFAHPDIDAGGVFGLDNTTIWISFSTQLYAGNTDHFGGLSLILQGTGEVLFIGSPWQANGWGIDDEGPAGAPPVLVPGTSDSQAARIVTRIDHFVGMDRLRMYIDPATDYPTGPADLDEMIQDLLWDEIRLASGGNNGEGFYFDNVTIAKGDTTGSLGVSYCGPAVPNSTTQSAEIGAFGSASIAQNSLVIGASSLPPNAFGFLITSRTQGFVTNPGGSAGNLCLSGAVGRYVGPGQIQNSGPGGAFSLPINVTLIPQPNGFVSALVGDVWNFQCWFRDSVGGSAVSNFTDGVAVTFLN